MSTIDIETLKAHLGDHKWRLNNLYFIRDKKGKKVQFRLNEAQSFLLDNLWFMNIIVKARQLGMCLDPNTKVLTADLQWVKIGEIEPGTEIISVDEFPVGGKKSRRMKTGVVEGVVRFKRDTYRLSFSDGTDMICTGKHPWLARKVATDAKWMTIEGEDTTNKNKVRGKKITVGTKIRRLTQYWENEKTHEDGWIGGMIDGEGSLSLPSRAGANLSISQVDGPVWDRLVSYFEQNNYSFRIERDGRKAGSSSKLGTKVVNKIVLSRMDQIMRLLGTTQPSRFKGRQFWDGKELPLLDKECWVTVTGIEHLGEREVVDLQTSAGTYIADGLVSHNTTFFAIFYLDQVLWSENKTAGIIAHREEDMRRIFRDKILFALRHLHPWLKELVGEPKVQTASELVFNNGGNIFVSMSTRGGTPNFLHISEYGYICAHDPHKADEILHGAINSVDAGQMVSIESTAEGREGHFYRLLMDAEKKRKAGRQLTELDFKSFFFPWWIDPLYSLSDNVPVLIPDELKAYFDVLEHVHGIKLTKGQKIWYVKKRETVGDGIFEQFPSTIDECFMVTIKGAYFANEMGKVYEQNRIGFFPVETKAEVNVAWDLGMNDANVLVFYQELGEEIRFVDFYQNSGYGLEHYVNIIREKGYRIGKNILPHDVAVRDLSLGISREQFLWDLGLRNIYVMQKVGLMEGIERTRRLFGRFRFNEGSTTKLVEGLHNYRRDFNKKMGVEMDTPRHDENSHIVDPVRMMALDYTDKVFNVYGEEVSDVNTQSFF